MSDNSVEETLADLDEKSFSTVLTLCYELIHNVKALQSRIAELEFELGFLRDGCKKLQAQTDKANDELKHQLLKQYEK